MELSPDEYGAYWGASLRVAAGVLLGAFGTRVVDPLLAHPEFGATALGAVVFVGVVVVSSFLVVLGLARAVRTAVRAERR